MRHFIFDVWPWCQEKHSMPLKSIRIEKDHFPTDREIMECMYKDEDVTVKMHKGKHIMYTNLREYTA